MGDDTAVNPDLAGGRRPQLVSFETGRTLALDEAKVVPDVLDAFRPVYSLKVTYKYGWIEDGDDVPPSKAKADPIVLIHMPDDKIGEELFTLVMVDPDAPSPSNPSAREWLHWIVANVPRDEVYEGEDVVPYEGPTPPEGRHRYVMVLYRQPGGERVEMVPPGDRRGFSTREFAKEYGLGDPVAARVFYSSPEYWEN